MPWKCPGDGLRASPGTNGTSPRDGCSPEVGVSRRILHAYCWRALHENPRAGILRTLWEPNRVLRSPFRGLCVHGAHECPLILVFSPPKRFLSHFEVLETTTSGTMNMSPGKEPAIACRCYALWKPKPCLQRLVTKES